MVTGIIVGKWGKQAGLLFASLFEFNYLFEILISVLMMERMTATALRFFIPLRKPRCGCGSLNNHILILAKIVLQYFQTIGEFFMLQFYYCNII